MTLEEYHIAELELALDPTNPRHISPPPQDPGKKLLDVGCGAGQTLIAAYPDRVCYGLDIDARALALGNRLTASVRFARGRAEALPYREAQFDMVISRCALPYTDIRRSLKEIRRVLKPGGQLWITLHSFSLVVGRLDLARLKTYGSFAYVVVNSALFHLFQRQFRLLGKQESFQTKRAIRRALERNGFCGIEMRIGRHFLVTARACDLTTTSQESLSKPHNVVVGRFGRGSEAA